MECQDVDKVKALDTLLDDQIKEFESGKEGTCDKELDRMMWELNNYDEEAPAAEAKEFADEYPVEEELVEKKLVFGRDKKLSYTKDEGANKDILPDEDVVAVHSMNPDEGE